MNKLRIVLLSAALLSVPFFGTKAYDWMPVGDGIDDSSGVTSYATESDAYADGDRVLAEEGLDHNGSFYANAAETDEENTVYMYGTLNGEEDGEECPLKIDGDVTLGAVDANLTVNIETPVIIEPFRDALAPEGATEGEGYSQLIFETAAGKTITVNANYDLSFRGITDDVTAGDEEGYSDLYLTFKGPGQTVFKMADGTMVKFDGQMDESAPAEIDPETGLITPLEDGAYSANAGGCKVFVTMDQTAEQVNAGQNKVLFERLNDGDASMRTMVYVGPNSVFTYISDNYEGLATPTAEDIVEPGGYAAVGFDPSNPSGTGRMVLFVKGAYKTGFQDGLSGGENPDDNFLNITKKFPFNDGSIVVAGHYVSSFDAEDTRAPYDDETELGFNFSMPAGVKAIMRVTDDKAYTAATKPFAPTAAQRRGLLVINDCQNLGKYASDPYWDFYNLEDASYAGPTWAYLANATKNVRTGFVLGINGVLDVYDSAFLDYAAGASNDVDYLAAIDFDNTLIKKKNPSALMIDGMDPSLFFPEGEEQSLFVAANPLVQGAATVQPQIVLRGNAKAMFKNVASSAYGYMYNFWARDPIAPEEDDVIADPTVDFNTTLACNVIDEEGLLAKSAFDGWQLATNEHSKTGEGEHVIVAEGPLSVVALSNSTIYADPYAETPAARNNAVTTDASDEKTAVVTFPTILTDHTGREINIVDQVDLLTYSTASVARPLVVNGTADTEKYVRYNSPCLFINNKVSLFDTIFAHSDATKLITGVPETSEPGITGGERLFFVTNETEPIENDGSDPDRYRFPEFRLFNSELALHESLCASGVRFVAMDDPAHKDTTGSNASVIRFYDHGQDTDALVTGYGRLLMLGSELNIMADEQESFNYATQSAFLNVFKRNKPQLDDEGAIVSPSTVKLSLRNGNEFPADVPTAQYDRQRSSHYIWFGIPATSRDALKPQTGAFLGWPTTVADIDDASFPDSATSFPTADERAYPYAGETLGSTVDELDFLFKLDAMSETLACPRAQLAIEGNLIGFAGSNNAGAGAVVPVKDATDSGNVYVDFGGEINITEQPVDLRATTLLNTTQVDTTIAQRLWNDYDFDGVNRVTWYTGVANLPSKQVAFGEDYGVQPFGLNASMIDSNADTDGYVRIPDGEQVNFAWFYRDPLVAQQNKSIEAIERPTYLMYVGAGSDIQQFGVSGGTANDPFYMDISGDGTRPLVARVREFTTLKSTRTQRFVGEGDHAIIFAEYGGRFGLGSNEWNARSLRAWSILGEDFVSIAPMGDCTVDVNEDIIVADSLPFMATTAFGADAVNRMTIQSATEKEIRVQRGVILDLSGFGQTANRQEIAFGGKIKLVIEEGGGIRFPAAADVEGKGGVVLYFNDESQLVFEGISDAAPSRYPDAASTDANRIKILGKGQIWLNKNAKMNIFGTASVGIQADATTLATDVTISLQRQAQLNIGDANLAGGNLQVGNIASVTGASINFALAINGADAVFHTDRQGFFGLGAGFINGEASNPNGNAALTNNPQLVAGVAQLDVDTQLPIFNPDGDGTTQEDGSEWSFGDAWQIIPLSNVNNITITLQNGIIEHKNIADGTDANASLWALGQFSGTATFNLNSRSNAIVRGGGNIMYVPALPEGLSFYTANIWDYAGEQSQGEQYSILASGPSLAGRVADLTATTYQQGNAFAFTAPADLFSFLAYQPFSAQTGARYIDLGSTQFGTAADFVNTAQDGEKYDVTTGQLPTIYRIGNPAVVTGRVEDSLRFGVLSARADSDANPTTFTVVQ